VFVSKQSGEQASITASNRIERRQRENETVMEETNGPARIDLSSALVKNAPNRKDSTDRSGDVCACVAKSTLAKKNPKKQNTTRRLELTTASRRCHSLRAIK
jgi:hypothetical protein